eukprot:scaffold35922_cov65-Phaeocystis_antarctica.AAC.7
MASPHCRGTGPRSPSPGCIGLQRTYTGLQPGCIGLQSTSRSRSSSDLELLDVIWSEQLGHPVQAHEPMWKARWLRPRPAGSPEASLSAGSSRRLCHAPASLGQSTPWAALAGHTGLVFHIGTSRRFLSASYTPELAPAVTVLT